MAAGSAGRSTSTRRVARRSRRPCSQRSGSCWRPVCRQWPVPVLVVRCSCDCTGRECCGSMTRSSPRTLPQPRSLLPSSSTALAALYIIGEYCIPARAARPPSPASAVTASRMSMYPLQPQLPQTRTTHPSPAATKAAPCACARTSPPSQW
jgi:hypothetical protein